MSDLLPANATEQEREISLAIKRHADLPVPVRDVWDPDACQPNLLPWLAWAFSLDTWDNKWTDAQKRGVIKASIDVHKRKGTIGALRSALSGLGYDVTVIEWFEKTPTGTPYTFSVDVEVKDQGIDESFLTMMLGIIDGTKNLRSHLEKLRAIMVSRGPISWGAVATGGCTLSVYPEEIKQAESLGTLSFGAVSFSTNVVTSYPTEVPDVPPELRPPLIFNETAACLQ